MIRSPGKGRQAEAARNDEKVLQAAREVFATQGWDAPVSAVAQRAGVGMGSLYRRYGSKTDLLQYLCILSMQQNIDAARTALALEDAWDGLVGYIQECVAFGAGAFAPLAGTIEVTDDMIATAKKANRLLARIVARAHQSGRLRADVSATDVWCLIEQFGRRSAVPGAPEDANAHRRLVAIALDGLGTGPAQPLPGSPPGPHVNAQRWARRPG